MLQGDLAIRFSPNPRICLGGSHKFSQLTSKDLSTTNIGFPKFTYSLCGRLSGIYSKVVMNRKADAMNTTMPKRTRLMNKEKKEKIASWE